MNLQNFGLENLINALPQNRPLYKDSGCWSIRTDDMKNEYMSQRHNETFKQFLIRYLEWVLEYAKEHEEEEILWGLTSTSTNNNYDGYHKCPKCDQLNGQINNHLNHVEICDV
jgi:tRNA(His) 5'-end guanylyltransferase